MNKLTYQEEIKIINKVLNNWFTNKCSKKK